MTDLCLLLSTSCLKETFLAFSVLLIHGVSKTCVLAFRSQVRTVQNRTLASPHPPHREGVEDGATPPNVLGTRLTSEIVGLQLQPEFAVEIAHPPDGPRTLVRG